MTESLKIINNQYVLAPNPKSGGMAYVYKATDMRNDQRTVAVKLFNHDSIEGKILTETFKRETEALKELKHKGIVKLFDSGIDNQTDQYFLVLEWMEQNLFEWLPDSRAKAGWDDFAELVALPLLEALAFAHSCS